MEAKIKLLISELESENRKRTDKMSTGTLSDYNNTVYVHTYNNTIDFIKRLKLILE